jgi:hypothetical protein
MMAVWGNCYTVVFGEPPCKWAEVAINGLFALNLAVVALYLFLFRKNPTSFALSIVMALVETLVTALIWLWGGISVAGFYF